MILLRKFAIRPAQVHRLAMPPLQIFSSRTIKTLTDSSSSAGSSEDERLMISPIKRRRIGARPADNQSSDDSDSDASAPEPQATTTTTSRSTLINGNHVFPPHYSCYLLRSRATPDSQATYVGSTPRPHVRIRQHNGDLVAGAARTRQRRPWEMQMIVHGFPSKLTALQFEWHWQKPDQSRHLKVDEAAKTSIFRRNNTRNRPDMKVAVARTLLGRLPFRNLPLQVTLLTADARASWERVEGEAPKVQAKVKALVEHDKKSKKKAPVVATSEAHLAHLPPLPSGVKLTYDPRPVAEVCADFDAEEALLREGLWTKWQRLDANRCEICSDNLNLEDMATFSICLNSTCTSVSHLTCLARRATTANPSSILPQRSTCRSCSHTTSWGDVIRSVYALKQHAAEAPTREAKAALAARKEDAKRAAERARKEKEEERKRKAEEKKRLMEEKRRMKDLKTTTGRRKKAVTPAPASTPSEVTPSPSKALDVKGIKLDDEHEDDEVIVIDSD